MDTRIKKLIIIILNLLLYFIYSHEILVILLTSFITYYLGKKIAKNKNVLLLIMAYAVLIIPFIFYKYFVGFININLLIPLGISYYTLSLISYINDLYYKKYLASDNLLDFLLYSIYFPCLIIGPIIRYNDFNKEISTLSFQKKYFFNSLLRIGIGFIKKIIIANKLSIVISTLSNNTDYNGFLVLLGAILYSVLLYCDFSGGIDIVMGISKMFNIELIENFNHPFKSESIKEFWKRWHITLGNWLKDYIYIPLSGNRVSNIRTKINILITFIVSGLWHGTSYLLWGIVNGILVILNFKTKRKYLNYFMTFIIISLLWTFFIYQDTFLSIEMLLSMFTKFNIYDISKIFSLGLNAFDYLIILYFLFVIIYYENKRELIEKYFEKKSLNYKILWIFVIIFLVLLFGRYGIDVNINGFIYESF